jgi:hypothetical protein
VPDNIPDISEVYRGRSAEIAKLAAALCKAQAAMGGAKKDSTNPHFKNKYADLGSVWDAVRKPLTDNGLAVVQFPRTTRNGVEIETTLLHVSGEYMSDVLWMPVLKMDAMSVGSAITYGRRYSLMSVTGIAPVNDIPDAGDDDGVAASDPPHKPGVPGMAAGGTDFRPDGPRRMPTSNWVDDAMNDGIVDQRRSKGALPPKPANGNGNAIKRAEWCAKAIEVFKAAQSKDELTQWWKAEAERLRVIEDAMPAEYERLIAAYDSAIERTART